jgi:hypothetical protein
MGRVVIACAQGDALPAARLHKALGEAGREAVLMQGAPSLKPDKAVFDAAAPLVLVWSRRAAIDAALLREAGAAAARGALMLARIDAVRPPPALRGARGVAISLARPQRGFAALIALLGPAAPAQPGRKPATPARAEGGRDERSTWRGTLLIAVVLFGLAWSAYTVAMGAPPVDVMALIAGLRA